MGLQDYRLTSTFLDVLVQMIYCADDEWINYKKAFLQLTDLLNNFYFNWEGVLIHKETIAEGAMFLYLAYIIFMGDNQY